MSPPDMSAAPNPPEKAPEGTMGVASTHDEFSRQLYAEYAAPLLSLVLKFTDGDKHWAEDVVQESLLRAWRHADQLRHDDKHSLLPWLVTVARRIVIDDLRRRKARSQELTEANAAHLLTGDDAEQTLQRILIKTALAELSPAHREAIVDVYFRGRTVVQLAKTRGIPLGTAKSRVYYALRALRHALRDLGVE